MTQPYQRPQPPMQQPPPGHGGYPTGGYPTGGYYPPPAPPKKTRKWPWIIGGIVVLFIMIGSCNSNRSPSSTATPATSSVRATVTPIVPAAPTTVAAVVPPAPVAPPAPAAPAGPVTSFEDAETLAVGEDIAPGQYVTNGAPGGFLQTNCYYEIHKQPSGNFSDLVKNGNIGEGGKGRVSLKAGQYFSSSGGCTWTKTG